MTLTVDISPQVEARVQKEAARHKLSPEAYVAQLVTGALPEDDEAQRREQALALLRSVGDLGDEAEQRETFDYLRQAVDEDRLSERERFGS